MTTRGSEGARPSVGARLVGRLRAAWSRRVARRWFDPGQGSRPAPRRPRWPTSLTGSWQALVDSLEPLVEAAIRVCGWSAILFVFAIFLFVFREAWPMLGGQLDFAEFLTSPNWRPSSEVRPQYGILALLVGTLSVTGLAMLLAVPLGLGAAVYISEFCRGTVKETLKILVELLAAIPSIVWGFISYMVLAPVIVDWTGAPVGGNLLNGGGGAAPGG